MISEKPNVWRGNASEKLYPAWPQLHDIMKLEMRCLDMSPTFHIRLISSGDIDWFDSRSNQGAVCVSKQQG